MKTLLAILISVVGLNAYALLKVMDNSLGYIAAECFPSTKICNGMAPGSDSCTCPLGDTDIYFGRVGMPHDQGYLDGVTTYIGIMKNGGGTTDGYHPMGDGGVWHIKVDPTNPNNYDIQMCTLNGDPSATVGCTFTE